MSGQKNWMVQLKAVEEFFEKYKYVLLVILMGVLLLVWPESKEEKAYVPVENTASPEAFAGSFDLAEMERKLSSTLSKIEGAGNVSVLLTVKNSSRNLLAEDQNISYNEASREKRAETVVISNGTGRETPVLVEQIYPAYQGALVVCDGGDNGAVRLKLVEAVAALTGLGSDKICICKGK